MLRYYQTQVLYELHKIVGSASVLGNPVGLLTSLATGVGDFFYEPALGLVRSPEEFGIGFARGTFSLLSNSVGGIANTASKVGLDLKFLYIQCDVHLRSPEVLEEV